MFAASFVEFPPLSTEISRHANGQRTDVPTDDPETLRIAQ